MSLHPPHHSSTSFSFIRRSKVEKFLSELGVELFYNTTSNLDLELEYIGSVYSDNGDGRRRQLKPPLATRNRQQPSPISPLPSVTNKTQLGLTICSILGLRYVCWASWASSLVGFGDPPQRP